MYFTQEDYRKIEKWLLANSTKDTEFAGAATPLKGNETLAFVQDGKNVNVRLKDLVDQIFLLGVSDFLNVSDKYGESIISLTQAIQLIPFRSRKIGQVITFLDEEGHWRLYQFQGKSLNQWNNSTLWIDLLAKISGIPIIDSEDITTKVDDAKQVSLYLADKQYNEADYSGLGKIYLRKNIQTIIDPSTGKAINSNLLTQSMLVKENTIYILQYDYNLNNQTITIPEGCILDMRGGSVTNGTINCVDTIIISTDDSKLDVALTGTYRFDSEKLVTSNTEDINISQSVDRKSHTISAMLADRDTANGMGYVILRKDKSFKEQVTQENTIYEIRYDFDLNGEEITIPNGCILNFNGGSISNGTLNNLNNIDAPSICIFRNVQFTNCNEVFKIDWLVADKSTSLTSMVNSTKDVEYAFNSGVTKIDLVSTNYFYISNTIEWSNNIEFIGIDSVDAWGRNPRNVGPCFHTDKPITMFKFNLSHSKGHVKCILKGFNIYNWYKLSTAEETYNIPLVEITNANSSSPIWGLDVNMNILAVDNTVPKTINASGDYVNIIYSGYIGILLKADNGAYITYVNIDGNMSNIARCVKVEHHNSAWITDITCNFDSERFIKVIEANGGEPLTVGGSHQSWDVVSENEYEEYPVIDIKNINRCNITGTLWDLAGTLKTYNIFNGGNDTGKTIKFRSNVFAVKSTTGCSIKSTNEYNNLLPFGGTSNIPYGTVSLQSYHPMMIRSVALGNNILGEVNESVAAVNQGFYFDAAYQESDTLSYIKRMQPTIENFTIHDEQGNEYFDYEYKLRGRSVRGIKALFEAPKQFSSASAEQPLSFGINKSIINNSPSDHSFTIKFTIKVPFNYRNGLFLVLDNLVSTENVKVTLRAPSHNIEHTIINNSPNYWNGQFVSNIAGLLFSETGGSTSVTPYYIDMEISTDLIPAKSREVLPYVAITLGNSVLTKTGGGDVTGRTVMHNLMYAQGSEAVCYAPNNAFKVFSTTAEWQEILTISKTAPTTAVIMYRDMSGEMLCIKYDNYNNIECNAKNVLLRCEKSVDNSSKFYSNSNIRQVRIFAKTLDKSRTFIPDVIYSTKPIEFTYNEDITDIISQEFGISTVGTLENKPTLVAKGFVYYATDIDKPIWHKGSGVWVDATGATV